MKNKSSPYKAHNIPVKKELEDVSGLRVSLPNQVRFTQQGRLCEIYMDKYAVCSNLQEDASAFEGWALVLNAWLGWSVRLAWARPKKTSDEHYQRFLYRVIRFATAVKWFAVDKDCKKYLADSKVLDPSGTRRKDAPDLLVNVPGSRTNMKAAKSSGALEDFSERDLELMFFNNPSPLLKSIKWSSKAQILRQTPVGVFKHRVSSGTRLFPGAGGRVDLGALDDAKGVALFELKKPGNVKVGALSEILFYCHVIRDIQGKGNIFTFDRNKADVNEERIRKAAGVAGYILADRLHPLLDKKELFAGLNASFASRHERFGFISYSGTAEAIKCKAYFHDLR